MLTEVEQFWEALAALPEPRGSAPQSCLDYSFQLEKDQAALRREHNADDFSLSGTDFVLIGHTIPVLNERLGSLPNDADRPHDSIFASRRIITRRILVQKCAEAVALTNASRRAGLLSEMPRLSPLGMEKVASK
jgi:hypothetical protein